MYATAPIGPPRSRKAIQSAAHKNSEPVTLFISYASEDKRLVDDITTLISDTFGMGSLVIRRDVDIKHGKDWVKSIDKALDEADILLVVFTDQMKSSHSYTGYEVGYFQRSIRETPTGSGGCNRTYIPFCIGAEIPDAMQHIQGVSISAAEAYKILQTDAGVTNNIVIQTDGSVVQLLNRLSDFIISSTSSPDDDYTLDTRRHKLDGRATELYNIAHSYLQNRVSSQTYPERKLIIRTPTKPKVSRNGADFSAATVELVGDFSNILEISQRQIIRMEHTWSEFGELIPAELRANLLLGIQKVAASVLSKDPDNYYLVPSAPYNKSYRLFVSKIITYVSKKTEILVYLVQMKTKDYGDPYTTRLLKSINVGLRFRSLVLEEESEFRWEQLGYPSVLPSQFKDRIAEMLMEMDLILNEVAEANITDPSFLIRVWGKGNESKVKQMIDTWEVSLNELHAAADGVLNSIDDSGILRAKGPFLTALRRFSEDVETMNGEFTARVLHLLAEKMENALKFYEAPYLVSHDKNVSNMKNINAGDLENGSSVANGRDMSPPH
jgi:TIR domain